MGYQPGLDAGVTGLVSMQVDGSGTPATFTCRVFGWKYEQEYPTINRAGRGAPVKIRQADFDGNLACTGKVQLTSPPLPSNQKYATGNIILTLQKSQAGTTTASLTFPVYVSVVKFEREEESQDNWDIDLRCKVNGVPTLLWNGVQVAITPPSPNDQQTYQGLGKIYDPNNITTRATQRFDCEGISDTDAAEVTKIIAIVAAGVAPIGGLKIDYASMTRSDSGGIQVELHWAEKDSVDRILFPATVSSRAAIAPYRDSTSVLLFASGTVASQANTQWATAQTENFIENITVRADPTPGLRQLVKHYINPGIGLRARTTGPRWVMSRLNGSDSQLYIMSNLAYGTGMRLVQMSRTWVTDQPLRRFILTRMIPGTTVPDANPATIGGVTLPNIGQVNSTAGTFNTVMGVAALTTSYNGAFVSTNIGLSGVKQFYMGYLFTEDPLGIVSNIPERYFVSPQPLVTTATSSGWVSASLLGLNDVIKPTAADFSAFITPYP